MFFGSAQNQAGHTITAASSPCLESSLAAAMLEVGLEEPVKAENGDARAPRVAPPPH